MKIDSTSYIDEVKASRFKNSQKYILDAHKTDIGLMLDSGLNKREIHKWFQLNKIKVSYYSVCKYVSELAVNKKPTQSKQNRSANKASSEPSLYDDI